MIYARLEDTIVKRYGLLPRHYLLDNGVSINLHKMGKNNIELVNSLFFYEVISATPTTYQSIEPLLPSDLQGNKFIERLRDWTQEEIDDYDDGIILRGLEKIVSDGIEASNELNLYLNKNLTEAQYNNAIPMIKPVWSSLRMGHWQNALDEMNAISVNNEPYISMKNTIITKIENYINNG